MGLNWMKTRRALDTGEQVGLNWIDCTVAAFQVAAGAPGANTDIVFTLPVAAGATDIPPNLVVPAIGPPAVQGDIVTHVRRIDAAAMDANIGIVGAWVSLAGGPGVGQITVRFQNSTAAAIPAAPAARTFRFFLDR